MSSLQVLLELNNPTMEGYVDLIHHIHNKDITAHVLVLRLRYKKCAIGTLSQVPCKSSNW